jgi:hypothetical protein
MRKHGLHSQYIQSTVTEFKITKKENDSFLLSIALHYVSPNMPFNFDKADLITRTQDVLTHRFE